MTKRSLLLIAMLAYAGCTTNQYGQIQTPGDRLHSMADQLQAELIANYGYQAYAECRGRGLRLSQRALIWCLEATKGT